MYSFKSGSRRSSEEESKDANKSANTIRRTCEFIPIDLETEMELARDEPLPDVTPIEETSGEFDPLVEKSNDNSLVALLKTWDAESVIAPKKVLNGNPLVITNDQVNIPSKSIMDKTKPLLKDDTVKSKLYQTKDTKNVHIFRKHIVETPIKQNAPIPGNPAAIVKNSKVDSVCGKFNSNLDLGVDDLPLITPVKNIKMGKENFINPLLKPRQNFYNHQVRSLTTPSSKFSATPIAMDKFNKNVKTPKNCVNLLKNTEISSTSRISVGKAKCEKFSKIIVNGTEYINLKVLGKGGSSVVYQCFDDAAKENRAIKCVSLDSPISSEDSRKEIEILKKLQNCDRIIKMYNYQFLMQEKKLYVVLEIGSVDLAQILKDLSKNEGGILPSYMILFYWMEMLYAVQQIHSHGIIHSDLKPANFLQINGRLKLIDFGISSCVQDDTTSVIKTVSEGSSNYISPEALTYEYSTNISSPNYGKNKYKISYRADVWSLGCILYQLIYKRPPFHHISNLRQKLTAIANSVPVEYSHKDEIPQIFLETIKKCLVLNAKSRPSVDELISEYEQLQFCKI